MTDVNCPKPAPARASPRLLARARSSDAAPSSNNLELPVEQTDSTSDMPRQRSLRRNSANPPTQAEDISADERTVISAALGRSTSYDATASSRPPVTEPSPQGISANKISWMGFGAIELENKGSVARDHLALERTFLAWLRTSLGFASIGIAITQLFRLNSRAIMEDPEGNKSMQNLGKPLGATFIAISIMVLLIGVNRYYESQGWLLKGKFPASRGSIFLLTLVACLLMVATLVIVVIVQPSSNLN